MIKALILDIDGIILGHQEGITFPLPTPEVQTHLQNLAKQFPISLCTVKAYFAVRPIIEACGLQNYYHITDAGASLVHGTKGTMVTTGINLSAAKLFIEELRKAGIYTEWYEGNEYFAIPHDDTLIRDGRTKLLGKPAITQAQVTENDVSKIIAFPINEWQTTSLLDISKKYTETLSLHWGINPSLIPKMCAFFTNPSATKRSGVQELARMNKIPLRETLAMGDSTNDWTFMELCGYVGTIGNGSPELKELVQGRNNTGYVSDKNVEGNGVLEVLQHWNI